MRWILLVAVFTATTASALVVCIDVTEAYAPTFVSATVDDEDAFIDPTPDAIVAGDGQTVEFRYGDQVLRFTPAGDAQ